MTTDYTGDKYGRWTVLGHDSGRKWFVRCECGTEKSVDIYSMRSGDAQSCGCLRDERTRVSNTKHGYKTRQRKQPSAYNIWGGIRQRCENPNNPAYKWYGARGIKVCDRWQEFANFYADMGDKPPGRSIDRIDNDGDYSPDNCRWATPHEQRVNSRPKGSC